MNKKKEPGNRFFWLVIFILMFVVVPYGFVGESQPRLWGLPLWFNLSLAASLVISLLSAWRIWKSWSLEDDVE